MEILKEALKKEAEKYITSTAEAGLGEWILHCTCEPSDELVAAFQTVDIEDEEEYEEATEPLIVAAFMDATNE